MSTSPPSLELLPMDPVPSAECAPVPSAEPAPDAPETIEITPMERVKSVASAPDAKTDRFAREAAQQYAEGHIDQPLWDRAYAQANGDRNEASEIYLRARATALRLLDRERRDRRAEQRGQANDEAAATAVEREAASAVASARFGVRRALGRYRVPLIAAGVLLPLVVGGWLLVAHLGGDAEDGDVARVAATSTGSAARQTVAAKSSNGPGSAGAKASAAAKADAKAVLIKKIQAFRDAGNWNMLVLYSVEWTRQEPDNVAAWNQLRAGYLNLHQLEDALGAARKAVEIAPADAALWREVAQVNVGLEDLAGALRAYEQAAVRNPHDIESLRQVAVLNARLGCVAESKQAFERALALAPDDAATLRLRAAAAQQALAPKETHAAARQVKTSTAQCSAANDTVAVMVK